MSTKEREERTREEQQRMVDDVLGEMAKWNSRHNAIRRAELEDLQPAMDPADLLAPKKLYPRWETGVAKLDDMTTTRDEQTHEPLDDGGVAGVTIIGGETSTGKSSLALRIALMAAEKGHCVVYYDGENDEALTQVRIQRYYGPRYDTVFRKIHRTTFFWVPVYFGHEIKQITRTALSLHTQFHCGALFVMDSINAIGDLVRVPTAASDPHGLSKITRLVRWMDQVVRSTAGQVGVVALSELNKDNQIYGQRARYVASTIITMTHAPEMGDDAVKIRLDKNRGGRGRVDLGVFERDWRRTRFEELKTQ